jgi:tetratricopeptide (TPR) repeat protein
MIINYRIMFVLILSFFTINQIALSQTDNKLVREDIAEYQHGNYENAVDLFNDAIKQIKSTESEEPNVNDSEELIVSVSEESVVKVSEESYIGTSDEKLVGVSTSELTGTSTEKYISDPLSYDGSELGKIYLYRGRTNMQLGNKEKAFQDFDKAVQLNPSNSEAYFRRAIASQKLDKDNVCEDLLKAMKAGHSSAELLYDEWCN